MIAARAGRKGWPWSLEQKTAALKAKGSHAVAVGLRKALNETALAKPPQLVAVPAGA